MTAEQFDLIYDIHCDRLSSDDITHIPDSVRPSSPTQCFKPKAPRDGPVTPVSSVSGSDTTGAESPTGRHDYSVSGSTPEPAVSRLPATNTLSVSGSSAGRLDEVANVKEYAVGLATTLARQLRWQYGRDLTARTAGFQLARLMLGAGFVRPDDLRDVSGELALACGFKPAAVWSRFVKGWDMVLNPVGDDAFDRLVKAVAGMTNAEVSPHPGPAYLRVALLAWQLQLAADEGGDPLADFVFPTTRIEKSFNVHRSSAASAVTALVDRGVLVCTSPDYSFFYRKARRFRFVGSVTIGGGS